MLPPPVARFLVFAGLAAATALLHLVLPLPWSQWALLPLALATLGPAAVLFLRRPLAESPDARLRILGAVLPVLAAAFLLHQVLQVAAVEPQRDQMPTYTALLDFHLALDSAFVAVLLATARATSADERLAMACAALVALPLAFSPLFGNAVGWAVVAGEVAAVVGLGRGRDAQGPPAPAPASG